jgi:zinc transport system permease protein
MLEYAFMQRALIAAVGVGVLSGLLGFFVVLRRLAFVGVGISHAAIGGVALGVVLGFSPLVGGAGFALASALAIAWISHRGTLHEDTAMGILFAGSMALGVVLFSTRRGAQPDLFGYLFGNVLAISRLELWVLGVVGLALAMALWWLFRPLLLVAFDAEVAAAYGHPVLWLDVALLTLVAAAVIVGVRLVGVILIEALLVIPAASAALWSRDYRMQLWLSGVLGAASGVGGLWLAYSLDLAAGGTIALTAVMFFVFSLFLTRGRLGAPS